MNNKNIFLGFFSKDRYTYCVDSGKRAKFQYKNAECDKGFMYLYRNVSL